MPSLYDPGANLFLSLNEGGAHHFWKTIKALSTDEKHNLIERKHIEELVEYIQISLLLGSPDPNFVNHPAVMDDDYRAALDLWNRRFKNFLGHTKSTHFHIM